MHKMNGDVDKTGQNSNRVLEERGQDGLGMAYWIFL